MNSEERDGMMKKTIGSSVGTLILLAAANDALAAEQTTNEH